MGVRGSTQLGGSRVADTLVPVLICNTNMMEAARQAGVRRYLYVGSINEYPPLGVRHEDDVWAGPPQANDRYAGIAKRVGEVQAEAYLEQYGWDAPRIVRLANVYGPFDDFNVVSGHVIPALVRRVADGENPLKVAGDGSAVRDFIYVEDVVEAMLRAVLHETPCLPINIGSGKGVRIRELVETLIQVSSMALSVEWDPSRPSGDPVRILDTERAQRLLNFRPRVDIAEGLGLTLKWYRNNRALGERETPIPEKESQ